MLFQSSIAVTGFAALSSAFLVPPTIASANSDVVTSLPFDLASEADGRIIKLECPGCPVPFGRTNDGMTMMMHGLESELQLDFEVNHLKAADVLTLNGVQLFPINAEFNAEPLRASQIITTPNLDSDSATDLFQVGLGYESRIQLVKAPTQDEQLALYSVRIQIVEVSGQWVDGIEAIEMKLISTPAGGLLIADMNKLPTTNPTPALGAECTTMICKFRDLLDGKLSQLTPSATGTHGKGKGCHGKSKGINRHGRKGGKHTQNGSSHRGHGPHHHRHHHRLHRFLHAMKSIALQVLIPVSIGIACGMAASFVGMIVGHAIVFLWRTLYRRGQLPTYTRITEHDSKINKGLETPHAYVDEKVAVVEKSVEL